MAHVVLTRVGAGASLARCRGQAATLLGVGLQHKTIDDLEQDLKLEGRQLLANFNKVRSGMDPQP